MDTKQEHLDKIESVCKLSRFFKWVGYKNPAQSAASYKRTSYINPAIETCFKFYKLLTKDK